MSRCFPFPPPGYELKGRPDDDVDLIVKETEKHKKHKDKKDKKDKKEKKDKEKKGKKEKRERKEEEGEDKHKDKKDKKRKREKHRDKKDKKEDKPSSSGEKASVGPLENQNDQKLVPDSKPTDRIRDERTIVELGDRVKNEGATGIQLVQKITFLDKEKANLPGKVRENGNGRVVIKDPRAHSRMANGQTLQVDSRSMQNARNGHRENQIPVEEGNERNECPNIVVAGRGDARENGNGKLVIKDPRAHSRMANGRTLHVDSKSLQNGRNGYGENQITVEDGKERNEYPNIVVAGRGDASKRADKNKNPKAEDKKGKKEEKRELTGFRRDDVKLETSNGSFLDFHSNIPSDLLKENGYSQGKLPKLKELNGFLHAKDSGVRPNNISRHAIASHQAGQTSSGFRPSQNALNLEEGKKAVITDPKVNGKLSSPQSVIDNVRNSGPCRAAADNTKTENGRITIHNRVVSNGVISPHIVRIQRKMEPCQTSNNAAMAKQIASGNLDGIKGDGGKTAVQMADAIPKMMQKKESGLNGSLDGKKHSSKRKEKTTTKPPHPDEKYLSQILTVPEVEWPQDDDDQEWLFGRPDSETKRPRLASPETRQVWSEAVHLKSADVTALPYVVPY